MSEERTTPGRWHVEGAVADGILRAAAPALRDALAATLDAWRTEFVDFFGEDSASDFDNHGAVLNARAALRKAGVVEKSRTGETEDIDGK